MCQPVAHAAVVVVAGHSRGHEGGRVSTEGSSHDSEEHSDLIIHRLGDGPELRQYLAPEVGPLSACLPDCLFVCLSVTGLWTRTVPSERVGTMAVMVMVVTQSYRLPTLARESSAQRKRNLLSFRGG